jgi:UDP-N-acetyl-alpha-D-muramoyl-L-alanyl-L-glutamate epimerase
MNLGLADTPTCFDFLGWEADETSGEVRLHYAFAGGESFCETLQFGAALPDTQSPLRPGFAAALDALHLAAGISYYKAYLPPRMRIVGRELANEARDVFQTLYCRGLGEFSARNRIKAWERVNFPYTDDITPQVPPANLARRTAVLLGGGKDSLVSIEALRAVDEPMVLFAVNPQRPMVECADAAGLPLITVRRRLDEKLFALNAAGALNGHVPVTAIVSLIALAGAFVHGYDTVVLSAERSADEGNLVYEGRNVNHQYSKTLDFERLLGDYAARNICPTLSYFSLLRPLSELHIANLMARNERYDATFTSCNRAFVLRETGERKRWCCDCPKCRFAFLILAGAMGRPRVERVFGRNLLDDPAHLDGYRELVGLAGHKPWECVGEIAESAAALLRLSEADDWHACATVAALAPALRAHMPNWHEIETALMTPSAVHRLSQRYERILNAYLG